MCTLQRYIELRFMRLLIFLLAALLSTYSYSQSYDELAIRSVIDQLFDGMRQSDSTQVKPVFVKGATLASIIVGKDNQVSKQQSGAQRFIRAIGQPKNQIWNEIIWSYDIKIDGPMASAWTEYSFYVDENLSHCGVNVFELINLDDGWKISQITDTRRKEGCRTKEIAEIDNLMDAWHHAAAVADKNTFFGSMTQDGIYIGTDKSERWKRDDMRVWSQQYFDRESAWSFTKVERNVTLGASKEIAWFDEILDTWMGPCRGSGVVLKTEEGWKISHYHLAIAVPNEEVSGYLDLIGLPQKN